MVAVDNETCFIFILLGLFSVLCYSLFLRKQKDSRHGLDLPPSPPSLPIIGHLHLLLSLLMHKTFQQLASKYGTLLHLRIFNSHPIILVSSASVVSEIFKAQDINLSSKNLPVNEGCLFFGSSGFIGAPYGDYWKFMKKLIVTKLLGSQALGRLGGVREDELERFYSNLLDKAEKKESVDIGEEAMKLANNSMCKILMGGISPEDAEKMRATVAETDALTMKVFLKFVLHRPLEMFGISLFKKEFMGVSRRFEEVLERKLVEHEEKLEEREMDMMDVLLEAYGDETAEYKITRTEMKSLLVELLIGGSGTTAHAIEWTMAEIINNPKTLEILRGEIDSVVGTTRLIRETDIPKLPYLQAVVKEGLRLHPPSSLVVRKFQESCEIRGFYVPEKATLVVNVYAIMRDADNWEDPEEFKPERWFLGSSRSGQEDVLQHIPFGSGRRACPGENLAFLRIGTAIGLMVQCFDWRTKEEKVKMDEAAGAVTLTMAHPLHCIPLARTINPLPSVS